MEMNEFYEAPEVEVLEVKVERGFAGSGGGFSSGDLTGGEKEEPDL